MKNKSTKTTIKNIKINQFLFAHCTENRCNVI